MQVQRWVWVLVVASAISTVLSANEQVYPEMHCDSTGRSFVCAVTNCESMRRFPEWTIFSTPQYTTTGLAMSYRWMHDPKGWTLIECKIIYDDGHIERLHVVVAIQNDRAVFATEK